MHAHHGLHGLGEHLPVAVELLRESGLVQAHLAEAAQECLIGDGHMREADADVAQHGGVGEVALPA